MEEAGVAIDTVGVVLAAGAGERLRPLTFERPKALCPVGNVALVDSALARVARAVGDVAVNVHHGRPAMEAHFAAAAAAAAGGHGLHLSIEADRALGTAGAVGFLHDWIGDRHALVVNADTWCAAELAAFVAEWDRERVRILVRGSDPFGPRSSIVASLLPHADIAGLEAVPSGLFEACWREAAERGRVESVAFDGPFMDCGTPRDYLEANAMDRRLAVGADDASIVAPDASIGPHAKVQRSVVGAAAIVEGTVSDSVIWAAAVVERGEHLDGAVRTTGGRTVLIR